jgi:hypothetical protein
VRKNAIVRTGTDWRADPPPGYRVLVATVIPISDRRARLAFILSLLGMPSLGITIPAAIWLGVGSLRQRRLSSGAEPALGFMALAISGFSLFTLNSVLLRSYADLGAVRLWTGIAWVLVLATVAAICTASTLRIHPERWGALLVARAGLVGAMVGGTALLAQMLAVSD